MTRQIVVVGSLNMDLVVRTLRHPQIGESVIGHDFRTYPGGKGANQAVAAARLGSDVRMIGRIGMDAFGDAMLSTVNADGVDTTYTIRDPEVSTGIAFVTVDELGQNTIVISSGANARLSAEDVSAAEGAFVGASTILLQLECPLNAVERAISLARKHHARIVLNPAPAQLLDKNILLGVDYLIPNQNELLLLAGQDSTSSAIEFLRSLGVRQIVVTLGADGVLVVDGERELQFPAYKVPVVDTTAAGDAFVAGFAVALNEGRTLLDAVKWGNLAGALTVTKPGAQPSLPFRDELIGFLENTADF